MFATILFFLGVGILAFLKFLLRVILRKPRPVECQSVCVFFELAEDWKRDVDNEEELG